MTTALRCVICCPLFYSTKGSERIRTLQDQLIEKGLSRIAGREKEGQWASPYKPLIFSGGKTGIKEDGGKLYISVDENTSVIGGFSIKETMKAFKNAYLEDITTGTVSKYKITVDDSIANVDRNGLYILDKVMDENTFVFSLSE